MRYKRTLGVTGGLPLLPARRRYEPMVSDGSLVDVVDDIDIDEAIVDERCSMWAIPS